MYKCVAVLQVLQLNKISHIVFSTYCYVTVQDLVSAEEAVLGQDQKLFRGRRLTVALADPSGLAGGDVVAASAPTPNMSYNKSGKHLY